METQFAAQALIEEPNLIPQVPVRHRIFPGTAQIPL